MNTSISLTGYRATAPDVALGQGVNTCANGNPSASEAEPRSIEAWTNAIKQTWDRGTGRTLELARLMSRARASLQYGLWARLWQSETLPFSKRKGEMLVAIGQGVGGLDAQNSAQLPPAWNTLYYLARLGQTTVEQLIGQGEIHPRLSLQAARELLARHRPGLERKKRGSRLKARLARFTAYVRAEIKSWSETERRFVHRGLLELANEIGVQKIDEGVKKKVKGENANHFSDEADEMSWPAHQKDGEVDSREVQIKSANSEDVAGFVVTLPAADRMEKIYLTPPSHCPASRKASEPNLS
jgi:hypothetical protein